MTIGTKVSGGLTVKQAAFASFIFQGCSQRDAWGRAGYSTKYAPEIIDNNACALAHKNEVKARLAELRAEADDKAISTVNERKKILTEIQRARVSDFLDVTGNVDISKLKTPNAAVSEVTTKHTLQGISTTLKLRDPIASIAEHNRMERIGQPDTVINNLNDNRSITIVVKSEEGKQALAALKSGKLPGGSNAIEQG